MIGGHRTFAFEQDIEVAVIAPNVVIPELIIPLNQDPRKHDIPPPFWIDPVFTPVAALEIIEPAIIIFGARTVSSTVPSTTWFDVVIAAL